MTYRGGMTESVFPIAGLAPLVAIIDSDMSVRVTHARWIRSSGLRAAIFGSVFEFLRSKSVDETACLVLDVKPPDLNGLTLQHWFAQTRRHVRFIFVSASATDRDYQRAREAGAIAALPKPVDETTLIRAVQTAIHPANATADEYARVAKT